MKVDVHAHFYPKSYLDEVAAIHREDPSPKGRDALRVVNWGLSDPRMWSIDDRLEANDGFGVDMQILSLSLPNVYYPDKKMAVDLCQLANDSFIELAQKYPGRFRVFASIPLQFPDEAVRELDRMVNKPEVVGLIIGANIDGQPLDSPDFLPFYGELEKRNLPFFIHPMRPPGLEALMDYNLAPMVGYLFDSTVASLRLVLRGVFEEHPNLVMILPHLGAMTPYVFGRINWAHGRFDVSHKHISEKPQTYYQRFYYDTVCHSTPALHFASSLFGTDHIVFGSDFPFNDDVDHQCQDIVAMGLPAQEEEAIFSGNALRIFKERMGLIPATE
ncbi:MAG TPA: amidohydrolase family protein [Dehalococcoidia bacterium]|nr:amidohydrolase family protein [Dehalococcoidia bacterium]